MHTSQGVSVYSRTRMTTTTDFRTFCYLPSDTVPVGGHPSPRRPGPPAPTGLLLVSTDSPILSMCYEWNHRAALCHGRLSLASLLLPTQAVARIRPSLEHSRVFYSRVGPTLVARPAVTACSSRSAGHCYTVCCVRCVHCVDEFCSDLGFMSMGGIAGFMVTLFNILWNW